MEEEKDLELVEQYLKGELQKEELHKFEDRLKGDDVLSQLVEDTKELIAGIDYAARNETLSKLKSIEAELPPFKETKTVSIYKKPWVLGVAASISIVLFSVYYVLFQNQITPNEELFDQHFEVYPNIIAPTVRGAENIEKALKEKAYYTYDLGLYEEANELLSQLPVDEDEGAVYLYRGICYLMLDDNEGALQSFNAYKASDFELFLPQVNWFMGLTYLRAGEVERAKEVWEEIPEGNSYRGKVEEIFPRY